MCKGGKKKYYFQWCIYHKDNYNYSPNYNISCHPEERINIYTSCESCWKWTDCCADSPEECCIKEYYTFPPTNSPTLSPYSECLQNGCNKEFHLDKCNIFENIDNNDWLVVNQFEVKGDKRLMIVLNAVFLKQRKYLDHLD